ncbi:hypothetical protein PABY_18810 [Pyrodictium abyssi]|uniref:Uncharacterized protein n=1 Tax=Pyrodictium abyssi TaxID=54256 RepID=A0ABM8IXR9_9CREN|nr:hypothetical protein PABY_18810 [Pyrodictium abyssi]
MGEQLIRVSVEAILDMEREGAKNPSPPGLERDPSRDTPHKEEEDPYALGAHGRGGG